MLRTPALLLPSVRFAAAVASPDRQASIMSIQLAHARVKPFGTSRRLKVPRKSPETDAAYWSEKMAHVAYAQDRDSFMQIYDHYAPRVHRFLLGRGVAPAQAEDYVQEALLRVWNRAHQFDSDRASLSTWLFRIARNLHVDSIRIGQPSLVLEVGLDEMELEDRAQGANGPDAHTDHVRLHRAIDELPGKQARLIRMSYLESKSHREIAQELGMPLGTVKSIVRRSFEKLQIALRQKQ